MQKFKQNSWRSKALACVPREQTFLQEKRTWRGTPVVARVTFLMVHGHVRGLPERNEKEKMNKIKINKMTLLFLK